MFKDVNVLAGRHCEKLPMIYLLEAIFGRFPFSVDLIVITIGCVLTEEENQDAYDGMKAAGNEECDAPCCERREVAATHNNSSKPVNTVTNTL